MLPCLQIFLILPNSSIAVFSSVTVSLLALNQGNIWLYEDSVLICGGSSGNVSPVKTFSVTDTYSEAPNNSINMDSIHYYSI